MFLRYNSSFLQIASSAGQIIGVVSAKLYCYRARQTTARLYPRTWERLEFETFAPKYKYRNDTKTTKTLGWSEIAYYCQSSKKPFANFETVRLLPIFNTGILIGVWCWQ
jgi:hypothetical protein